MGMLSCTVSECVWYKLCCGSKGRLILHCIMQECVQECDCVRNNLLFILFLQYAFSAKSLHPCIISLRKGNEMHIQNLAHYIFIIGCVQKTISLPFFILLPLCSMHTVSHNAVHSMWPSISSVRNELEEICFTSLID